MDTLGRPRALMALGAAGFVLGGAAAMAMRWQLALPGQSFPVLGAVSARAYPALVTFHGSAMLYLGAAPFLAGLGAAMAPAWSGRSDTALPALRRVAGALFALGLALSLLAAVMPLGAPAAGWTALPPLSTHRGVYGLGPTLWTLAVSLAAAGALLSALDLLVTLTLARTPGDPWRGLPSAAWAWIFASALNVVFLPVLLGANLLILSDRVARTGFFTAGAGPEAGGDPMVYQHLFWIFGHPAVYIVILPVWGVVTDLLRAEVGLPPRADRGVVLAMGAVTLLAGLVYGHHLYTAGLGAGFAQGFVVLTLLVSLPSAVFFVRWLVTLWEGVPRRTVTLGYCVATVWVFALGGLTGLPLGAAATDTVLHGTHFVVGHFHFVMAAAVLFGVGAALSAWGSELLGRPLPARVLGWHLGVSLVSAHGVFVPMLRAGLLGMPRRAWDVTGLRLLEGAAPWQVVATVSAFVLGVAQLGWVALCVRAALGASAEPPAGRRFASRAALGGRFGRWGWVLVPAGVFAATLGAAGALLRGPGAWHGPSEPTLPAGLSASQRAGRVTYLLHCVFCHGERGDGRGVSGLGLSPPPRDFRAGVFKWVSTAAGDLPQDADLRRTISRGLAGTAMRPWSLSPQELDNLIDYLKTLSPRWRRGAPLPEPLPVDPWGPGRAAEAMVRGEAVYYGRAQCATCHPAYVSRSVAEGYARAFQGEGVRLGWRPDAHRGVAVHEEGYGVAVVAPDFTRDVLRNGAAVDDLARVIAAGVGGTPMPAWREALSTADLYALAWYVRGLAARPGP